MGCLELISRRAIRQRLNPDENGMATVLSAALLLIGAVLTIAMMKFGAAAFEAATVRNAADLAATSGAQVIVGGGSESDACAVARQVAAGMEVSCHSIGEKFEVVVVSENGLEKRAVAGLVGLDS